MRPATAEASVKRARPLSKARGYVGVFLCYVALSLWAAATVFPFWHMLVLATSTPGEMFRFPPPMWFGTNLTENYHLLMDAVQFWRNSWNSLYISTMQTGLTLFFCSLAGFGFAMYRFKFREQLFNLMLATIMIPNVLGLIPYFIMMKSFGWFNTPRALYVPGAATAFGIFLMRQYIYSSVSKGLLDAARIDGCSEFQIYWRIVLPLIKPGIGALGIITFLGSWNNFMAALVILPDMATTTIPVALRTLEGQVNIQYGAIMVGTALSILPIAIVYVLMSKQFISGLTEGAMKE